MEKMIYQELRVLMNKPIIDAHIHLDMYEDIDGMRIVKEWKSME